MSVSESISSWISDIWTSYVGEEEVEPVSIPLDESDSPANEAVGYETSQPTPEYTPHTEQEPVAVRLFKPCVANPKAKAFNEIMAGLNRDMQEEVLETRGQSTIGSMPGSIPVYMRVGSDGSVDVTNIGQLSFPLPKGITRDHILAAVRRGMRAVHVPPHAIPDASQLDGSGKVLNVVMP